MFEGFDIVNAEGNDLKIGHLPQEGKVFQVVTPKVEIFNSIEVIIASFDKN